MSFPAFILGKKDGCSSHLLCYDASAIIKESLRVQVGISSFLLPSPVFQRAVLEASRNPSN